MPVARHQAFAHDSLSPRVQRDGRAPAPTTKGSNQMPRYEQLGGNLTNSFISFIKEDLNATAAEMVYGTGIRLPADFFVPTKQQANSEFASRLKDRIEKIRPHPITRHGEKRIFVFRDLETSPYVFLRRDAIGDPFQQPYDGPYQVTERGKKTITIKINNKNVIVSIDRLKPAFLLDDNIEHHSTEKRNVTIPPGVRNELSEGDSRVHHTTRAGRRVRFPDWFPLDWVHPCL
uniref:uncharacterized protein LOC117162222 n=1 Tax=Bombus vancouverensis nearcticus TaxID=2705178 RepID=UPI00143893FF|nr:uncharacterized protein LOC117162222 [Bombus vancouverensis nearcticus]